MLCVGIDGITRRPDTASEDAFLRKIRSVFATADTSFDSTDSLDSSGASPDVAAATDFMRHSVDIVPMSSTDPLYAPPDFLRPVSGPAVPLGCRTKFKYVSFCYVYFRVSLYCCVVMCSYKIKMKLQSKKLNANCLHFCTVVDCYQSSFFMRRHVRPSHTSAEACLSAWPNAQP